QTPQADLACFSLRDDQRRPLRCEGCGLLVFWTAISDRAIVDQNERRTRHARQPARHDHLSRTVLSGQHQDWCSGRRVRSPPYRNERVAPPELRLQWLGNDTVQDARGAQTMRSPIYFLDATLASAFVARWCAGDKIETA